MLAFENELEYWNSNLNTFIGHEFSNWCEILLRFISVTAKFKTSEVVRPVSKILPHLDQLHPLWAGLLGTDVISK